MSRRKGVITTAIFLGLILSVDVAGQARGGDADLGFSGTEAPIAPGDRIVLRIWREEDMSGEYNVDESSRLTVPRLGTLDVSGMTAVVLQDSLRVAYARYLRNPSIEVTVLRRIGVHGEVREPDLYWVDLTMTLRELIAMAGGLTDAGDPNKVRIVRDEGEIRVSERGDGNFATRALRSGDQVVIGRRSWFAMNPLAVITAGTALISLVIGVIVPLL